MEVVVLVTGLPRDRCYRQVIFQNLVLCALCCCFVLRERSLNLFFVCYSTLSHQGVQAVIAKSFERIHRSNLVGMGIIPLCFKPGENADTPGLTGHERYTIELPAKVSDIRPGHDITVKTDNGKSFACPVRFDTEVHVRFLLSALVLLIIVHFSLRFQLEIISA